MREFEISSTGGGMLHCGIWAAKTPEPIAIVQVVHGIAEHIARYDAFGEFLAENGIVMVADDHMGHGRSAGDTLGFFPSGWMGAVEDEKTLMDRVREEYPRTPCFFLGHSMGSFLTRSFLCRYPDAGLAGAIISGTGWQGRMTLRLGLGLCAREEKKLGEKGVSDTLQKLIFGNYNRAFRPNRTQSDWLSRDTAVVDAFCADPLCGFMATVGLARDMLGGMLWNEDPKNLAKMKKDLPVFFFSGDRDPVGSMGKGVKQTVKAFRAAGMQDVTVKLYPEGRHEMLNELNRTEVYDDILRWIQKIIP